LKVSLKNNSVEASNRVTRLAAITGTSLTITPYTSHKNTPRQKSENMPNDKSFADRVLYVLITWGKKAVVVSEPANNPKSCIESIMSLLYLSPNIVTGETVFSPHVRCIITLLVTSIAEF
jgi:hypothetical protein